MTQKLRDLAAELGAEAMLCSSEASVLTQSKISQLVMMVTEVQKHATQVAELAALENLSGRRKARIIRASQYQSTSGRHRGIRFELHVEGLKETVTKVIITEGRTAKGTLFTELPLYRNFLEALHLKQMPSALTADAYLWCTEFDVTVQPEEYNGEVHITVTDFHPCKAHDV